MANPRTNKECLPYPKPQILKSLSYKFKRLLYFVLLFVFCIAANKQNRSKSIVVILFLQNNVNR